MFFNFERTKNKSDDKSWKVKKAQSSTILQLCLQEITKPKVQIIL